MAAKEETQPQQSCPDGMAADKKDQEK